MIGLALSGGGSRAMAFHLGCLRALDDLGLLEKVGVISTISGGSVIGAYYAYTPGKSFEDFETEVRGFLRRGFVRDIAVQMLLPQNLLPSVAAFVCAHTQDFWSKVSGQEPRIPRFRSRTNAFEEVLQRDVFPGLGMSSQRRQAVEVVIGACDLRTGTALRFGSSKSGNWRNGTIEGSTPAVSLAVAASAAYPFLLPAFDLTLPFKKDERVKSIRVSLSDGGLYDNLGLQVLEPGRNPQFSLHTFPCDYIVACNAGHGQDSGRAVPLGFFSRIRRSFAVIHRRVQDGAMHNLHSRKEQGQIRGFAMPYLGQQDEALPWRPAGLVTRAEVAGYPTDFLAMSDAWIEKLSKRGEQLTRVLCAAYLPQLLG